MTKNTIIIAIAILLLTSIGSAPLLVHRWQAEENDRHVEIAVPGSWLLQQDGGVNADDTIRWKESGATTVMLEPGLQKQGSESADAVFLPEAFTNAAAELRGQYSMEVMAYLPLEGFPTGEEAIRRLVKELSAAGIKRVQFAGMEVPGSAEDRKTLAGSLAENGMHTVLVKSQRGGLELTRLSGYQSIRSLFFDAQRLGSMPVGEAVDTFELGIRERGIRLVTFMPMRAGAAEEDGESESKLSAYELHALTIAGQLREQLSDDFSWGGAAPIAGQYAEPGKLWRTMPIIGIGALFLLLAGNVFEALSLRVRTAITLLIAAGTAFVCAGWMAAPSGWSSRLESVIALWGAITAPSAAVLLLWRWFQSKENDKVKENDKAIKNGQNNDKVQNKDKVQSNNNVIGPGSLGGSLLKAAAGYVAAAAITSAGIIYVTALLSDVSYLAYVDLFRGVKLLYVGPIALITACLLLQGGWRNIWGAWKSFMASSGTSTANTGTTGTSTTGISTNGASTTGTRTTEAGNRGSKPLKIFLVMAALLASGAVMAYLLARTGNSDMVLPYEGELRQALSDLFGVRPRTKEWLIGHPLLMAAACMLACRRRGGAWLLPLGAIGLCSMVNTFTHLHSPLAISLTRSLTGIVLGGIIGIVAYVIMSLWKKRNRQQVVTTEGT
ncbi:hypothetical protein K0T92_14740 [Paenibacillus oenotherae]|uniref:Uncharacterized protein n=1 Tax=Paenibacillus oenotherae TaxID=1435645 RepID=A0ABS7D8U3_9BACL|nr:DUF5693 family protein [Paenibacillus oenotherae]MBW7476001.1 hypothetical protein [Paenibacillus oenotherae]